MNTVACKTENNTLAYVKLVGVGCQLILIGCAFVSVAKEVAEATETKEIAE